MKKPLKRLDLIHQRLIDTISPLNAELFSERPSNNQWSVAEIVQHLCLVETRVLKDLEDAMNGPPQRVAFFRRFIPTPIVSIRLIRVKSPKAVRPLDAPAKDVAIDNFNRARNALKTLCATHSEDRFRHVVFKHPFLGDIDGVATISFVGYHERRHYKQIREVLKRFSNGAPKENQPQIYADKRGSEQN